MILSVVDIPTAKLTSVGGTWISLNVPDIESLPPIAAVPKSSWALYAPRSAARGLPHDSLLPILSKYSWNVSLAFKGSTPIARSLRSDSTTEL